MMTHPSDQDLAKVLKRYEYLTALRDCPSASDGEKSNAQTAIDALLFRNGMSDSEMQERLGRTGLAEEFYIGDDLPHMAKFKLALLALIADTHRVHIKRFQNGQSCVLIGRKDRVKQASDLYVFLFRTMNAEAEKQFISRLVRFGPGSDEMKPGWVHSFREGTTVSVKERLLARAQEKLIEEAQEQGFSEEYLRDKEAQEMKDMLDELLGDPDIAKRMEELRKRMEEQEAAQAEADRKRDEAAGVTYNELGYVAGRTFGRTIPLQAEVGA